MPTQRDGEVCDIQEELQRVRQEGREDLAATERDEGEVGGQQDPAGAQQPGQPPLQSGRAGVPPAGQLTFQDGILEGKEILFCLIKSATKPSAEVLSSLVGSLRL